MVACGDADATDGGFAVHYPNNVTLPNLAYFMRERESSACMRSQLSGPSGHRRPANDLDQRLCSIKAWSARAVLVVRATDSRSDVAKKHVNGHP